MKIDLRNTNSLWASIFVETLKRLGLTCAVICPGSRSTPLAVAFAQQSSAMEIMSVLDERSAAFFALGRAKVTGYPAAVICTSGTAGANFYPALIEAKESRVPLLICTADRPPEMRECHSGQTIDQLKLYGNYPNWQAELAVPSVEKGMLAYLRQMTIHAWERSLYPVPGPVHLNIPFRNPLAPVPEPTDLSFLHSHFHWEDFFANITTHCPTTSLPHSPPAPMPTAWFQSNRGIIIAGVAQPQQPQEYAQAIAHLAQTLQFPVLAEGLSPIRNYVDLNPHLISTYDLILQNHQLAKQLAPEVVIQIGEMPTSKELRAWLTAMQPRQWVIDSSDQNLDPLHGRTSYLRTTVKQLGGWKGEKTKSPYLELWCQAEVQARQAIDQTLEITEPLFEGKIAWLLSQNLPVETNLFIANSMPVRDVEFFWKPSNLGIRLFFNRGANGIDGTLSTALGVAYQQTSVMLTGDLALLHDTNGFLMRDKFIGHLTIVLINNNGGGIFETLPIAKFDPPFEAFFATPQNIDFAQLCTTYNIQHELITSWEQLISRLNPLPTQGIRVLEVRTNRKADAKWRQEKFRQLAQVIAFE